LQSLVQQWTFLVESTALRRRSQTVVVVRSSIRLVFSVLTTVFCKGTVFLGVHTIAGKEVAIKLEPAADRNNNIISPLRQESKIYKTLMGGTGVPWIMWSGRQGDYNVMVIDLLGPSLEDLFKMCIRHFSLKTVLLLADQLVCLFPYCTTHIDASCLSFGSELTHYHL
jgi:serine/threonine protein kinase